MTTRQQSGAQSGAAKGIESIAGQDAIELLTADHREASDLFEQFENLSDRAKASKQKIVQKVCKALLIHTQIEEEILYPAVREYVKDLADQVDEAVVEHAAAKDLIRQLHDMNPDEDLYDAKVKVLSEEIEHHVEEEEKEMFPKLRQSKMDLNAIGQELAQRKQELQSTLTF
ncbi:hemerythrin domain-containing protein [Massilia sp. 9096]|uniref:hemerythrin domain-containing protein n=1 Tax=Massilia sp. 9096 TaxID=1500894 RepID=UPI0009DCA28F|nr:hemerythrin domain-containing protein [Massilia sp. 9096]